MKTQNFNSRFFGFASAVFLIATPVQAQSYGDMFTGGCGSSGDGDRYVDSVRKAVNQNWHPTLSTMAKLVIVDFKVSKDGKFSAIKLNKSSGNKLYDEISIDAIKKCGALKPPAGFADPLKVRMEFGTTAPHFYTYSPLEKGGNDVVAGLTILNYNNDKFDWVQYVTDMENRVKKKWKATARKDKSLRSGFAFTLCGDGTVSELELTEKSGDPKFDTAAKVSLDGIKFAPFRKGNAKEIALATMSFQHDLPSPAVVKRSPTSKSQSRRISTSDRI